MPPDLHNDQELTLKKRARRRLVGAIALVLLMVIILPRILQDRATLAPQEAIKISMPAANVTKPVGTIEANVTSVKDKVDHDQAHQVDLSVSDEAVIPETPAVSEVSTEAKVNNAKKLSATKNDQENKKVEIKTDVKLAATKTGESKIVESKSVESKTADSKPVETKSVETKPQQKNEGSFTIQVGVFSDIANVRQLQARLKHAGFTSHTETITTPKGEKIRLRAGSYSSRQDAAYALTKLQAVDLNGMVISND